VIERYAGNDVCRNYPIALTQRSQPHHRAHCPVPLASTTPVVFSPSPTRGASLAAHDCTASSDAIDLICFLRWPRAFSASPTRPASSAASTRHVSSDASSRQLPSAATTGSASSAGRAKTATRILYLASQRAGLLAWMSLPRKYCPTTLPFSCIFSGD
jgi:hypothetical protein